MEITLALLADAANFSQEGKLNILGNFSQIVSRSFPATHAEMHMVMRLEADPAECGTEKTLDIVLMDADGHTLRKDTFKFKIPASTGPSSPMWIGVIIHRLLSIQLPGPGRYEFKLLVNGETKTSIGLSAVLLKMKEQQQ